MFEWLKANLPTIIGAAIVFGVFVAIIVSQIRKRKQGKGGCSCGCSGCANAGACHEHRD